MAINVVHSIMSLPKFLELESFTSLCYIATIHQIIVVSGKPGCEVVSQIESRIVVWIWDPHNVLSKLEHRLPKIESRKPTGEINDRAPNIEHREPITDHRLLGTHLIGTELSQPLPPR
jgi:hypothetical protein